MPQIFQVQQIARPSYYDRQPEPATIDYVAVLAPFPNTLVATYEAAFPQAAFIEAINVTMIRSTAAGVLAVNIVNAQYTGDGVDTAMIMRVFHQSNVVNNLVSQQVTQFGYMGYGDKLDFYAQNGDTGGTVIFAIAMKGIAFIY